jgi:hypothetical protein
MIHPAWTVFPSPTSSARTMRRAPAAIARAGTSWNGRTRTAPRFLDVR